LGPHVAYIPDLKVKVAPQNKVYSISNKKIHDVIKFLDEKKTGGTTPLQKATEGAENVVKKA
jgi:hypothetical protein